MAAFLNTRMNQAVAEATGNLSGVTNLSRPELLRRQRGRGARAGWGSVGRLHGSMRCENAFQRLSTAWMARDDLLTKPPLDRFERSLKFLGGSAPGHIYVLHLPNPVDWRKNRSEKAF